MAQHSKDQHSLDARRRERMASSLAKHRYFTFVATSSQMDDAEGIARVIRQRALAALGEVGLGRLDPRVSSSAARQRRRAVAQRLLRRRTHRNNLSGKPGDFGRATGEQPRAPLLFFSTRLR